VSKGSVVTPKQMTLVVALSGMPETGVVLRTALGVAQLMGMGVEAVHVAEEAEMHRSALAAAHANGVRVHHRKGEVVPELLEALASRHVFGAVMGARTFIAGPRPTGSTALRVLRATSKPVVFVPPEVAPHQEFVPRRLLVPVDGSPEVSDALFDMERHFRPDATVEVVVLYVLDGLTPAMVDHPEHELSEWGREFVLRYFPGEHRSFEWCTGDPGAAVVDVADQSASDLVVLCFGGDIDVGHGAVLREVLARSQVPVLVLPAPPRVASSRDRSRDPRGVLAG
jgi:nucleotide-binding universal stress UspA family protein